MSPRGLRRQLLPQHRTIAAAVLGLIEREVGSIDQLLGWDRLVHINQQRGQHAALTRVADIQPLTITANLDIAQQTELQLF